MELPSQVSNITTLVGDAFGQLGKLLQVEIALAKAEFASEARQFGVNLVLMLCGAMFLMPALVLLLFGVAAALVSHGLSEPGAYFAAGGLGLVIAVALIAIGIARVKAMSLYPERTAGQLRRDRRTLTEVAR